MTDARETTTTRLASPSSSPSSPAALSASSSPSLSSVSRRRRRIRPITDCLRLDSLELYERDLKRQETREEFKAEIEKSRRIPDDPTSLELDYFSPGKKKLFDADARDLICALQEVQRDDDNKDRCVVRTLKLDIQSLSPVGAHWIASFVSKSAHLEAFVLGNQSNNSNSDNNPANASSTNGSPPPAARQRRRPADVIREYEAIMDILLRAAGKCVSLRELRLEQTYLGYSERHRGLVETGFQEMLRRTKSLRVLSIRGWLPHFSSPYQVIAAGCGFRQNTTIETLEVGFYQDTAMMMIQNGGDRHRNNSGNSSPLLDTLLLNGWHHASLKELIIDNAGSSYLGDFLGAHRRLERLCLHNRCLIDCGHMEQAFHGLAQSASVKSLVLNGLGSSKELFDRLAKLMQHAGTTLERVDLSSTNLFRSMDGFSSGLHQNTTVHTLNLSKMGLRGERDSVILRGLVQNKASLKALYLNDNIGLGPIGSGNIAQGLRCGSTLSVLDVSGCGLGDQGVVSLCESIGENTSSLKVLMMNRNNITFPGLSALADMLEGDNGNCSLEHLGIANNAICMDNRDAVPVGETVAGMLRRNTSLARLDLAFCNLSSKDVVSIVRALQDNESLRHLNLNGNQEHFEAPMLELGSTLPYVVGLETLEVSSPYCVDGATWAHFMGGIQRNRSLLHVQTDSFPPPKARYRELQFCLARNRLMPFIHEQQQQQQVPEQRPRQQRAHRDSSVAVEEGGLWPYLLACNERHRKDPVVNLSIIHHIFCHKPALFMTSHFEK